MTNPISPTLKPGPIALLPVQEAGADESILPCFEAFASLNTSDKSFDPQRQVPVLNVIQEKIPTIVNFIHQIDPEIYTKFLDPHADKGGFLIEFLRKLHEFKKTGNSQKLVEFLTKCANIIKSHPNPRVANFYGYFSMFIYLFENNRLDLFKQPLCRFLPPLPVIDSSAKYRVAVNSFRSVALSFFGMFDAMNSLNLEFMRKIKDFKQNPEHSETFYRQNCEALHRIPSLTRAQKCDILRDFQQLSVERDELRQTWLKIFNSIIGGDLWTNYNPIIFGNPTVEAISKITAESKEQLEPSEQKHVQAHLDVYRGFLPRVQEMIDILSTLSTEIAQKSRLSRNYHLYLQFGNHTQFIERLGKRRVSKAEFKRILHEEIANFNEKQFAGQIAVYLAKPELQVLRNSRLVLKYSEEHFSGFRALFDMIFETPMEFASEWEKCLFTKIPRPKAPKPPSPPPAAPEVPVLEIPSDRPKVKKIAAPLKELEEIRKKSESAFEQMLLDCRGFGTMESLRAAQSHLDDVLCTVLRLFEQTQLPLGRHHLHAFVVDCVRHGTLAVEQMLSALCRESNGIKNPEQLREFLSHNLYLLLTSCKLKAGPFPAELRKCIRDINRGEILVRDLDECKIDASSCQALLVKTRLFLQGEEAFSSEDILSHAFGFLIDAADICQEAFRQLDACKAKPDGGTVFPPLSALFQAASKKIAREAVFNRLSYTVEDPSLKSLRENLENLIKRSESLEVESGLQNVLKHLLVHLETEMLSHPYLNPIIAHSHCSNFFLYNQMIAQEVLVNLLVLKEIPDRFDEEDHDLWPLVEALGMKEKDFTPDEIDFLRRGKATRQIVRYTASYNSKDSHRRTLKAIRDSLELFKKQPFTHHYELDKGFEIGNDSTRLKLERVKAAVKEDIALLNSIIIKATKVS